MDVDTHLVASRLWTPEDRDLWQRITTHAFENPDIALDFTRRLARILDWSVETAKAGIEEYRRFCFLGLVTTGPPVTPSEEVDEIWHLHLTYTRDYWDRWCGETLGRKLHHDPTAGGPTEQSRYRAQYAETLALYESYFGPPPAAFWPGTAKRFAAKQRYRMVDTDRALVVRKPVLGGTRVPGLAALFALVTTPAAAADTWNPLNWPGDAFLMFYIFIALLTWLVSAQIGDMIRATGRPTDLHGLTPVETAYVAGGATRASDTLFLELAARQAAFHTDNRVTIAAKPADLPRDLEAYRAAMHGTHFRSKLIAAFTKSPPAEAMRQTLTRRNIILDATRRSRLKAATSVPLGLVLGLGITKIFVGLSRGKPIFFLLILCVLVALALVMIIARAPFRTKEGDEALDALRRRVDRAVRAPRREELALAFAIGGAAVLAGTEHAAYAKVMSPPSTGDGGSGCSGGSGCGGGGGGCGGCSS